MLNQQREYRLFLCLSLIFLLPSMAGSTLSAKGAETSGPEASGIFILDQSPAGSPEEIAAAFLGLPYRNDGAINEKGEYTLFANRQARFSSPGLNCSGLVVAASRLLLGVNFNLDEVTYDRLGDSGPDAPNGQDWDFGWDLVLNISEGFSRCLLLPGFVEADPAEGTGLWPRGYDIHLPETWRELPERLRPGHLYLISLNMEGRGKLKGLRHYHVGFIHVARSGEAWFYQTTGKGGGVNRRDLKSPEGIASFKKAFANSGGNRKMMLVVEVPLP